MQLGLTQSHAIPNAGEKPYKCPVDGCGKGFTCSKQLKVHSRTHTGEKPYHCDICFRDFGYNHVLKLHRVQHYGAKCYKCTICDETFKNKKEMEAHIKGHANEIIDEDQQTMSSTGGERQGQQPSPMSSTSSLSPSVIDAIESQSSNSSHSHQVYVDLHNGQQLLPQEQNQPHQHHPKYRKLYEDARILAGAAAAAQQQHHHQQQQQQQQHDTPRETSSEATNSDAESDYFNSFHTRFEYGSQSAGVALLAAASLARAASSSSSSAAVQNQVTILPSSMKLTESSTANAASSLYLYEPLNIMRPNGLLGAVGVQQGHNQGSSFR